MIHIFIYILGQNLHSHEALADKSILESTMEGNPWLVKNVQAFSFLNCPECTFKVKEANLFQDHAEKNHLLSSVLFGTNLETESVYIKTEPNEDITEHPMIETEPNENIIGHQMIKAEPIDDSKEHQIIDPLNSVIDIKNEPLEEPIHPDISEHHIIKTEHISHIDRLDSLVENGKTLEKTIYPDLDKKASTSQPNRLKRIIGAVDTSLTIKILSKMKKNLYSTSPSVDMQGSQSAQTSDQTNIQLTMETENSNSEPEVCRQKPYMSYAKLIAEALKYAPEQALVLSDIYKAISTKHPYYKLEIPNWQNSIRQTLTVNKNFIKGERSDKRGWYWKLSKDVPKSVLETTQKTYFANKRKVQNENKCEFCNKDFETRLDLIKHIQETHGVKTSNLEKRYACDICDVSFYMSELKKHRKLCARSTPIHSRGVIGAPPIL